MGKVNTLTDAKIAFDASSVGREPLVLSQACIDDVVESVCQSAVFSAQQKDSQLVTDLTSVFSDTLTIPFEFVNSVISDDALTRVCKGVELKGFKVRWTWMYNKRCMVVSGWAD